MSTKVVKKKLTDLPVYVQTTASSGSLHYREGNVDYQFPITSILTPVSLGVADGYKYIGEVSSFAALRLLPPSSSGVRIKLRGYSNGSVLGGGEFIGYLGTAVDDGGVVAAGSGFYWVRINPDGSYTPEMFGAMGDGTTDDTTALNRATNSANINRLVFEKKKTYIVTGAVTGTRCTYLDGSGSVLKMTAAPTASYNLLSLGVQKGSLTGLSIPVAQYARTITIPGISAIAITGDLISLGSDSYRLQFDNNYYYGQRAVITGISGDVVTINSGIYEAFTINSVTVHRGDEPITLQNLTVDVTGIGNTSYTLQAVSVTGVNMLVSNCKLIGSSYCAVGLGMQGCVGRVTNCLIGGFLHANGTSARVGYGIYLDGCDLVVSGNNFYNNKHCVTSASRRYLACGIVIENNLADTTDASTAEAVFDMHYNVVGVPVIQNNHIYAGKAVFNARNGGAKFINNYIYNNRTDGNTSPGVIAAYECPTVYYLEFSGNYIETSSNVRLIYLGDITTVQNIYISNNTGKLGSIFNQGMNITTLKNVNIENNNFSGLTQVFEMSRRSQASTQLLFSNLEDVRVFNNTFDLLDNGTVGVPSFHIWSHSNNPVANKLAVKNFVFKNNTVKSKDTPVLFEYVNGAGHVEFCENTFTHTVSANATTAPTQNSVELHNSNFVNIDIKNNNMSGRVRFAVLETQKTSAVAYFAEDVAWKVGVNGNTGLGCIFDSLATTSSLRYTFGHSQVKHNIFVNPYGSTVGFTAAYTTMGWNSGGVVDVSGNTLFPASGSSVGISLGLRVHKIAITSNIMSAAISDAATPFLATPNSIVSLT